MRSCATRLAALTAALTLAAGPLYAQGIRTPGALAGWQAGAVLDVAASSAALALGQREKGPRLGHSDLVAYGPLGNHVEARLAAATHSQDGRVELELDEAWFQSRTLPVGLQLRAGRFLSQVSALNEQHPHADDFVERPLLYRAFLGGHWSDDGLRINWTAPTSLYVRLGAEVLRGRRLVEETDSAARPGVVVLSSRVGGDLGASHSWQAGLSYMRNRREAALEHGHEDEADHGHGHHGHAHGAAFTGRHLWLGELTWKWAPQGNNRLQQVRVSYERALVKGLNRFATDRDRHVAQYLAVVWRFAPSWEVGGRADLLRVRIPHDDHFDGGRLREAALMLAYKPTHLQTLRLQLSEQRNGAGFDTARRAVQLQYVLAFGAHPAHAY